MNAHPKHPDNKTRAGNSIDNDARRRIFDAAVALFALKGYHGVGTREIARQARVNIAMLNYYYGGKVGILRAIVDECHEKYTAMLVGVAPPDAPVEEHVRLLVRGIVGFFRQNIALALVGFSTHPIEEPEVMTLRNKWYERIGTLMKPFYDKLGADTGNFIQMSLIRRSLLFTVMNLFESVYAMEQGPEFRTFIDKPNNAMYDQFADSLTSLYLHGYKAVVRTK